MSQASLLRKLSLEGIISFALRSMLINILKILSVYLLAIWFMPEDYGTFGIILSWFGVACFFCDIGLAPVLVRQQLKPSKRQLETTMFVQLLLSTSIAILFIIFAQKIVDYNSLSTEAADMIRILFISLPILALRNPSKIQLERTLQFKKIAAIELAESLILYIVQLGLAWRGLGALSVIWANFARSALGSLLYIFAYNKIYLPKLSLRSFKSMVSLGWTFQANALLPSLKALIFPLVVGKLLEVKTLGLISWTIGIVSLPQFIALNYNTVFFPILSRLKANSNAYEQMNTWAIGLILPIIGIIYIGIALFGGKLSLLIFGAKWQEAAPLFELSSIGLYLYLARYIVAPYLNANGKSGLRLKIEGVTLVCEIGIVTLSLLVFKLGAQGYLYAIIVANFAALVLTAVATTKELQKLLFKIGLTLVLLYFTTSFIALYSKNLWTNLSIYLLLALLCLLGHPDLRAILNRRWKKIREIMN